MNEFLNFRHSQNGLSRERMSEPEAFDEAMQVRIAEQVEAGTVNMVGDQLQGTVTASVIWGKPLA